MLYIYSFGDVEGKTRDYLYVVHRASTLHSMHSKLTLGLLLEERQSCLQFLSNISPVADMRWVNFARLTFVLTKTHLCQLLTGLVGDPPYALT